MANKKISELTSRTPALSDLILVGDPSSGYSYKCTVTALATIIETDIADGYVTIGTTQTISGAKTFSNNLTLTSVANATITQTKFLTLNGSNVVNYRTGAEVLADIGGASSSSISGTTNYIAKFTSSSAIGNSTIQDNGSLVTIGSNTTINTNAPELTLNQGTSSVSIINFKENNSSVNRITSSGAALYFTTNNSATTSLILSSAGTAVFGTIPNATIDTDKFLVSDSGVLKYRTGAEVLSDIGGQGTITLAVIGSTPNANGATLSSNTLTLQPASASFGGVLTTGFQEIAGWKRFTGNPIQFDNHLEIKNLNSWGVSWGYTSFASKDTPVFGFLRGHSSTGSVTYNAWFTYGTTGDRNYTLPSSDGTLALTSDITSSVSGTTNYIPKFTSSSAIGDSPLYDASGSIGLNSTTPALNGFNREFTVNAGTSGTARAAINIQGSRTSASTFGVLGFYHQTTYVAGIESSRGGDATSGILQFFTSNTTGATERMRLDASGNLGLGTSSPVTLLDVRGEVSVAYNASYGIRFYNQDRNNWSFIGNSIATGNTSANLRLGDATGEVMRITGGNVGIGTTSPSNKLDVNGNLGITTGNGAFFYRSANDYYWRINNDANNFLNFGTYAANGTAYGTNPKMILLDNGNVGIGTTSPTQKLDVNGKIRATDDLILAQTNPVIAYDNGTTGALRFASDGGNTERMRITSGGNVGIGTTSPGYPLEIRKSTGAWSTSDESFGAVLGVYYNTANVGSTQNRFRILANQDAVYLDGYDAFPIIFRNNGNTERMRITSGGEVYIAGTTDQGAYNLQVNGTGVWGAGAYVNGSDSALKQNIQPLDNSLDLVKQMKPVTYNYKESYSKDTSVQTGFIAQDLQLLLKDKNYLNGIVKDGTYLSVAYQNLIPLLVKAIQEQQLQIENLKNK